MPASASKSERLVLGLANDPQDRSVHRSVQRPGDLITAALSSQIADGAAALLIASDRAVREHAAPGSPRATGARLLTTLAHALRRTGGRYGMVTMCEGGGQANVTIIERA